MKITKIYYLIFFPNNEKLLARSEIHLKYKVMENNFYKLLKSKLL